MFKNSDINQPQTIVDMLMKMLSGPNVFLLPKNNFEIWTTCLFSFKRLQSDHKNFKKIFDLCRLVCTWTKQQQHRPPGWLPAGWGRRLQLTQPLQLLQTQSHWGTGANPEAVCPEWKKKRSTSLNQKSNILKINQYKHNLKKGFHRSL